MVDESVLGRLIEEDPRDANYPMLAALPARASTRTYRYWWANGAWLNQGSTGTCVGHAWAHWIEDGPVVHEGTIDPYLIYREACKRDDWPDNDNGDLQFGTSVRAAVKYLLETTRVTEYLWAWKLDTVVQALLTTGPLVIGSWWYDSMFTPNSDGLIRISGSRAGGHAYVLNGVNTTKRQVRMKNSWGKTWGKSGLAYIGFDDLERLMSEQGEVCLALETPTR